MAAAIWTTDLDEKLKAMRADGMSATEIASELPGGFSRNAVLGRCFRLHICAPARLRIDRPLTPEQEKANRRRRERRAERARQARALKAAQRQAMRAMAQPFGLKRETADPRSLELDDNIGPDLPSGIYKHMPPRKWVPKPTGDAPAALGLPLESLAPDQCRYPYGDQAPYLFCGHAVEPERSYCPYHFALCHSSAKEPAPKIKARGWGYAGLYPSKQEAA